MNPSANTVIAPHHPHHAEHGFDWREYYYAIKSRAWIVVFCVILFTFFGIFKAATRHSQYSATAVLFIEQVKSNVLNQKVGEVRDEQIKSMDMINTLVDLLRSYKFALRVVNRLKLTQDREFLSAAGFYASDVSPERAAGVLCRLVKPGYRLNTRLIDISVTTRNPQVSVKLANAYAEEYLHYIRDQETSASRYASTFLMDEAERLRKKMRASEEGMQSFRERERAASIDSMLAEAQTQITDLSTRQNQLQSKLTQIDTDLEVARQDKNDTQALLRLPSVAAEPKVAALVTQLDSLQGQLVLIKQRYRAKHPLYINVTTQIQIANDALNKELSDVVGLLESIKENLQAQLTATKVERETAEKRLLEVTGKSIEYNDLKRELESDSALYNAVLGRIKEVDVTKELSDSPVQLQEEATGAVSIGSSPVKTLLQAILLGLAVGLGLTIGLHKLDTSFKTVDQVEGATGISVVAAIPQIGGASTSKMGLFSKSQFAEIGEAFKGAMRILRDQSIPIESRLTQIHDLLRPSLAMIGNPNVGSGLAVGSELVVKDDRSGLVAEAFRSLRAAVAMNTHAENQRTFLLTSAVPSEGKSFCSANFASTLAQQGLKTLLIDSDLRKPTISKIFFGMHRKPGLSEVLLGKVALAEAANSSGIEGLSVLTAGGRSSNPSELLAGQPFRDLIAEALKSYDRVVIDSAPVLAVSDTFLIAPSVEVLCLVVRSFMTPRRMTLRAIKGLSEVHVKPAGIVFNCLPDDGGAYYYSGKYYGSYGGKGVYGS
jgi:capsular exopolysaccharide synthesis family protein